jgi:hypothetical protein
MATLFMTRPGTAVALVDDGDVGLPLRLDAIQGSWFPSLRSVLTEASFALDASYQFQHTLRDVIYAYTFGDRISSVRVGGIAFASDCADPGGMSGLELILQFWEANKISARATPMQLQIGVSSAGSFTGHLVSLRADIVRPEARLSQFAFLMNVFPATGG